MSWALLHLSVHVVPCYDAVLYIMVFAERRHGEKALVRCPREMPRRDVAVASADAVLFLLARSHGVLNNSISGGTQAAQGACRLEGSVFRVRVHCIVYRRPELDVSPLACSFPSMFAGKTSTTSHGSARTRNMPTRSESSISDLWALR